MSCLNRCKNCRSPKKDRHSRDLYGWLIVVVSLIGHVLIYGVIWSTGIFYDIFMETFDSSSGAMSVITTISPAFTYGSGPIAAIFVNKYGHRIVAIVGGLVAGTGLVMSAFASNIYYLTATFGAVTGIGFGFTFMAIFAILPIYFDQWLAVAVGIATSGMGLGTFVYPPLIRWLLDMYGTRGSLLFIGGLTYHLCLCGALLRPKPARRHPQAPPCHGDPMLNDSLIEEEMDRSDTKDNPPIVTQSTKEYSCSDNLHLYLFKNYFYLPLCVHMLTTWFGLAIVNVHISAYATEILDISEDTAALAISALGAANCVGRPLCGLVSKLPHIDPLVVLVFWHVLCGIILLLTPLIKGFTGYAIMMSLVGFFSTAFILVPRLFGEFINLAAFPSAFGYLLIFTTVGTLAGSAAAGYAYDSFQTYVVSFYLSGSALLISGLVMIIPGVIRRLRSRNSGLTRVDTELNVIN